MFSSDACEKRFGRHWALDGLAGDSFENARFLEPRDQFVGRWIRRADQFLHFVDGHDGVQVEVFEHPVPVTGHPPNALRDRRSMIFSKSKETSSGFRRLSPWK